MKQVSNNFKTNISSLGRRVETRIYDVADTLIATGENVYDATLISNGEILKSLMRELDLKLDIELQINQVIRFTLGINEEFIDYGQFIVFSKEYNEAEKNWKYVCYDGMLNAMKDYEELGDNIYPITIGNFMQLIANAIGMVVETNPDAVNLTKEISSDYYKELEYTYRDILDELSAVVGGTIYAKNLTTLAIKYPTETNETIGPDKLKDINVSFATKYGPINSVVLSRSAESDNVYIIDTESVEENGLTEIKIIDNQIMNWNDRSEYLPGIFSKLHGLEYAINDFSSTGITYLEYLDKYNVQIDNNTYNCLILNDEIKISQGLEETIYTDPLEETKTDYSKSDKVDRKTNLIVDKQNQKIQALIEQIGDRSQKTSSITQDIDTIDSKISDIEDLTDDATGSSPLTLENCIEGNILELRIKGNNTVFQPLYPANDLYPGDNLIPLSGQIKVTSYKEVDGEVTETIVKVYELNVEEPLRKSGDFYDELVIENGKKYELRRIQPGGTIIENPPKTNVEDFNLELYNGRNVIEILPNNATMYAHWAVRNDYTKVFATKTEMTSEIKQSRDSILLIVSQKVDENEIIASINTAIEDGQGIVRITGNSVIINSDYFNLNANGIITAAGGSIAGWNFSNTKFYKSLTELNYYHGRHSAERMGRTKRRIRSWRMEK